MNAHHTGFLNTYLASIFLGASIAGLAAAYIAAAAGLLGWLDARAVSFWTLSGGAAAFVTGVMYLAVAYRTLQRRLKSVQ